MNTVTTNDIEKVIDGLGDLGNDMVFVGGSVVSFYANDPAAGEARPTEDIDMTLAMAGSYSWDLIQAKLIRLGFYPDPERSICGFTFQGIKVDVMPSEDGNPGPVNSWYKPGFYSTETIQIGSKSIRILSAPYFIATKFEATEDRGGELRLSEDFEDIVFILDSRIGIVEEIAAADDNVNRFLKRCCQKLLEEPHLEECISAHLETESRFPLVLEKIKRIANS